MGQSAVSARYSEALVEAAEERGVLDAVASDVQGLLDLLQASDALRNFIADPMIRSDQKRKILHNLLNGKINAVTLNFVTLLCQNRRERILADILSDFLVHLDERRGVVTAQVTSAVALSEVQQAQLVEKLSAFSGKQVRLETTVDAQLKAGFVARLGDQVFDSTLAMQLKRLQRRLVAGV